MADKISSLDRGYETGDLSIFPSSIDTTETLYSVKNNSETRLKNSISYTAKFILVEDTSSFPDKGILRIDDELIYYNDKTATMFRDLKRGFALSVQTPHDINSKVTCGVNAESHNACKDAIIKIEETLGTKENPDAESLNGLLTELEIIHLAPKPKFRAYPLVGAPPLKVRFQNFSGGPPIRFLWDFGDGTTSVERNPTHIYRREGLYTVKLNMITSLGAQGFITKEEYIRIDASEKLPLFYAETLVGTSIDTDGNSATEFTLVDQTDGDISSRYWLWDDGENTVVDDPDIHTATHQYQSPGEYEPSLLIIMADGKLKRVSLEDKLLVS